MDDVVMFNCRFPDGVREAVAVSAHRNKRSKTAEILHMISVEPAGPLPEGLEAVGARKGRQFGLRMPTDEHARLLDLSRRSGRSMQGELLYRVISALIQSGADISTVADARHEPASRRTGYPSDELDRMNIRLPDGLRDALRDEAKHSNRSMNSELVARLEASFDPVSDLAPTIAAAVSAYVDAEVQRRLRDIASKIGGAA